MEANDISFGIVAFDWDTNNLNKNRLKHGVSKEESEEVFFNKPIIIFDDEKHSLKEKRYKALGKTNKGRKISLVFTFRGNKVRIITVRDQSKKERRFYEKEHP